MKSKVTPTAVEKVMREEDFIVSKTDMKGRITYGNRVFIEFSGYTEQELLGSQHNIVRHPDMPRAVFKLLWDSILAGDECFAYVKNMAKDGSFYWVFANVTPSYDPNRNMTGFLSVRRKPKAEAVGIVGEVYRDMLVIENRAGPKDAIEASSRYLSNLLAEKGMSYEEFVLAI